MNASSRERRRIVSRRARERRGIARRRFAEHFGTERRVDRAAVPRHGVQRARERVARQHGVDAAAPDGLVARMQARTEHPPLAPFVQRLQEQRGALAAAVDDHDRARLDDAGQVEELIALTKRLLAGALGGPLNDRDGVADARHHAGAARRELLERKDVGPGEDRLRPDGRERGREEGRQDDR